MAVGQRNRYLKIIVTKASAILNKQLVSLLN